MKKALWTAVASTAVLVGSSAPVAQAQWVVTDPTNLIENTISALQNVQTVLNQISQLAHEVQSLANEAQNLQSMPASVGMGVINQYTAQFGQLVAAMQSINGNCAKRRHLDGPV